jgi:hypothetical protein
MAHTQILIVENNKYPMTSYSFSTYQNTDGKTGRPTSMVSLSRISMSLCIAPKDLKYFWLWAKDDSIKKDGKLLSRSLEQENYEIEFCDGILATLSISDSASGSDDLNIHIEIAAREVSIDKEKMSMEW